MVGVRLGRRSASIATALLYIAISMAFLHLRLANAQGAVTRLGRDATELQILDGATARDEGVLLVGSGQEGRPIVLRLDHTGNVLHYGTISLFRPVTVTPLPSAPSYEQDPDPYSSASFASLGYPAGRAVMQLTILTDYGTPLKCWRFYKGTGKNEMMIPIGVRELRPSQYVVAGQYMNGDLWLGSLAGEPGELHWQAAYDLEENNTLTFVTDFTTGPSGDIFVSCIHYAQESNDLTHLIMSLSDNGFYPANYGGHCIGRVYCFDGSGGYKWHIDMEQFSPWQILATDKDVVSIGHWTSDQPEGERVNGGIIVIQANGAGRWGKEYVASTDTRFDSITRLARGYRIGARLRGYPTAEPATNLWEEYDSRYLVLEVTSEGNVIGSSSVELAMKDFAVSGDWKSPGIDVGFLCAEPGGTLVGGLRPNESSDGVKDILFLSAKVGVGQALKGCLRPLSIKVLPKKPSGHSSRPTATDLRLTLKPFEGEVRVVCGIVDAGCGPEPRVMESCAP